ncbi:MAG: hypothetical protein JW940_04960 [Polyangiaceae bacterium]|nr:hypothetical protein [Polyangiaceae bacterium]
MKRKSFYLRVWLLALVFAAPLLAAAPVPNLNAPELQGRYSAMHMLLEKTILKVDVLTVDVRLGKSVQARMAEVVAGKKPSPELYANIAKVAIAADDALVQLKFLRDVELDQWIEVVRENLQQARDAKLISPQLQKRISAGLPKWFAALRERGYLTGDRLLYRVRGDSLRTVVVSAKGEILVDRTDKGKEEASVVMASYYAPGSDFRQPLVRSLKL